MSSKLEPTIWSVDTFFDKCLCNMDFQYQRLCCKNLGFLTWYQLESGRHFARCRHWAHAPIHTTSHVDHEKRFSFSIHACGSVPIHSYGAPLSGPLGRQRFH